METQVMKGKRVLVTGSGTGIGRGIALEFAKEGANVALHYSRSAAGAESAVKEIVKMGGKAKAFKADLSKVDEVKKLGADAIAFLGGMDILISNAGITFNKVFEQITPEQYDRLYNVNCRALFFLCQAVVPAMEKAGGGVIITTSSNHAFVAYREHSVYAGTKGAICGLTRVLACELAPKNIRVLCIAPGWVRTENQEKVMPKDFNWEEGGKILPAGFVATPSDMGKVYVAMASEPGKYIFGHTIVADGGEVTIMPLTGSFRDPVGMRSGAGYVPGL